MTTNLLEGKRGIIFGALDDSSIAWKVAEKVHQQGGQFALSNVPIALRMGKLNELSEKTGAPIITADATKLEDLDKLFDESMEKLGGKIDFILHSIGMSHNVRKEKPYTDVNYDFFQKTLDISGLSLHKILQTAMQKDAMNEWGSVLSLSYIAAERAFPGYNDMAEAKALLESITRNFGYYYGKEKKVRINTISQSPTPTTAGSGIKGFDKFLNFAADSSPLGNASADECADFCAMMFSDFTRKITMQTLHHDGGFSKTGISENIMEKY